MQLHDALPSKFVPRRRSYSNIIFEATSGLVVAASSAEARFGLFDEEGVKMWDPDGELPLTHALSGICIAKTTHSTAVNVSDPTTECSSLELIHPDGWVTMDGYVDPFVHAMLHALLMPSWPRFEFANNEAVNAVDCVSLETTSTESGTKDFIAVGTTINRGEDLAVKGAVSERFCMPLTQ